MAPLPWHIPGIPLFSPGDKEDCNTNTMPSKLTINMNVDCITAFIISSPLSHLKCSIVNIFKVFIQEYSCLVNLKVLIMREKRLHPYVLIKKCKRDWTGCAES